MPHTEISHISIHPVAFAIPHPPKITSDRTKVNFHTKESSTSQAPLSQVI